MPTDPTAALHGRELTADERVLLRADPPAAVLRWCVSHAGLGAGARVARVAPLMGGTSSAVHAVDVVDAAGARERELVLRRFVREEWLEEEPDVPVREAAALELMRACPLPTPELVALDADGTATLDGDGSAGAAATGVPALLMTRVAGTLDPTPAPGRLDAYLRGLAEVLPVLHATPLPATTPLPDYDDWGLRVERPPDWTRRPEIWERAFAVFDDQPPTPRDGARRLIHRDYHAGNVLWSSDGTVSGVVDWASASVGSPDADVGTCRENLARAISPDAADRFLQLHRAATGLGHYDSAWDVRAALGGLDEDDVAAWTPREEGFLARAVARL